MSLAAAQGHDENGAQRGGCDGMATQAFPNVQPKGGFYGDACRQLPLSPQNIKILKSGSISPDVARARGTHCADKKSDDPLIVGEGPLDADAATSHGLWCIAFSANSDIPVGRIGRSVRIPAADVALWIEERNHEQHKAGGTRS